MLPEVPLSVKEDALLIALWDGLVSTGITQFERAKETVEALKPPTAEEMTNLIDSSEDESVIAMREALEEAEKQVEQLTGELETWATNTLSTPSTPDEVVSAKQALNRTRSQLRSNLDSMRLQAEKMNLPDAVTFIDEVAQYVSPKSSSPVSQDTKEEREWLRSDAGGNHKVSDKGRIPVDLHQLWLERISS